MMIPSHFKLFCLGQSSAQAFLDQVPCSSLIMLCHPLVLRDLSLVHGELALPGRYKGQVPKLAVDDVLKLEACANEVHFLQVVGIHQPARNN